MRWTRARRDLGKDGPVMMTAPVSGSISESCLCCVESLRDVDRQVENDSESCACLVAGEGSVED